MRTRRILVISLTAMFCAFCTPSVAALGFGSAPDVEPPAPAVGKSENDSFSIFMAQFDDELARYDELDSGPPPGTYEPPPDVPLDSSTMSEDVHMIRAYLEIGIYILIPVFVVLQYFRLISYFAFSAFDDDYF